MSREKGRTALRVRRFEWWQAVPSVIGDTALVRAFSCLEPYSSAVLAVSGGPDSMALMHLARRWLKLAGRDPGDFAVVTIDHKLRVESKEEAAFVAEHARALGFAHATLEWTGEKPRTGIQAAARQVRYNLLQAYSRSNALACIVTAHTGDDQAETFLMRLRRGSGVDGLAAMPAVSERDGMTLVRPLLVFPKARLLAYLRALSLPFIRDPSNENMAFERVRLRHAMKAIASAGLTRSTLTAAAARIGRSRDALVQITDAVLDRHFRVDRLARGEISLETLGALPEDLALRVIARVLDLIGGGQGAPRLLRVERLLESLKTGKKEFTLGGCILIASAGKLHVCREPGRMKAQSLAFQPGASLIWDRRFLLTFAPQGVSGAIVRQLGADGWIAYKKALTLKGMKPQANRLAALTVPALWKESSLICAPALDFFHAKSDGTEKPFEAALAPSLARFATAAAAGPASALGKDTPVSYL